MPVIILRWCSSVPILGLLAVCSLASADITITIESTLQRKTIANSKLNTGQTLQLQAHVSGTDDKRVMWSVREPGGGFITADGLYTAPQQANTYHIRAVSQADPGSAAELTVAVLDVRQPVMDMDGRFYLYRNLIRDCDDLPFIPYAWMPEEAARMLGGDPTDPQDKDGFNTFCQDAAVLNGLPDGEQLNFKSCIAVTVKRWANPDWCGIAFLSGPPGEHKKVGNNQPVVDPDDRSWWGEANRGWYYNFSGLKRRRLIFYGRGQTGGETIQIQFGILSGKPFGDSLKAARSTGRIKLTASWKQYSVDLTDFPAEELRRVCNPFTLMLAKEWQTRQGQTSMRFYLADIYLE